MPIDYSRFHTEGCGIRPTVWSWMTKARNTGDGFDRFYYLWSAFNLWALSVTLIDGERKIVESIGRDPRAKALYGRDMVPDAELMRSLNDVQDSFPLQNYADLIKIDQHYDWRANQGSHDFNRRIATSGKKVRVSPHLIPDELESVLLCTYHVRCNLMHGSKLANAGEQAFVYVFSTVLERLMDDAGLPSLQ